MATIKKGMITTAGEWWKHLRPFQKRKFWKRERRAQKKQLKKESNYDT